MVDNTIKVGMGMRKEFVNINDVAEEYGVEMPTYVMLVEHAFGEEDAESIGNINTNKGAVNPTDVVTEDITHVMTAPPKTNKGCM